MRKSDLKTEMYVWTRAGRVYMIMRGVGYILSDYRWNATTDILVSTDCTGSWLNLNNYTEDLLHDMSGFNDYDIVKVYAPKMPASFTMGHLNFDSSEYWQCIYNRVDCVVEMTVREIEEKLGIKNLKIVEE